MALNVFGGHTLSVTCVKWGGEGLIYSASNDLTIVCWTDEGKVVRVLKVPLANPSPKRP